MLPRLLTLRCPARGPSRPSGDDLDFAQTFTNHSVSSAIVSQTFVGRVRAADSVAEDPKLPTGRAREEWGRKGSATRPWDTRRRGGETV